MALRSFALSKAAQQGLKVRKPRHQTRHQDRPESALEAPIRQISENAGVEGSIVARQGLEESESGNFGFDAQNEVYGDMVNVGIIDPTKVVRTALQDAASVAGLLITTEAMVAEAPQEKAAAAPLQCLTWAAWAAWAA